LRLNFEKAKLLEIFFSKFSLKEKWNWHLTKGISYFLDLCGISYENLKLTPKGPKFLFWQHSDFGQLTKNGVFSFSLKFT